MEAAEVAMVVAALAAVATAAETSEKKGEAAEVGTAPDRTEGPQDRGCPHTAAAPRVNRKAAARAKHATEASTLPGDLPATLHVCNGGDAVAGRCGVLIQPTKPLHTYQVLYWGPNAEIQVGAPRFNGREYTITQALEPSPLSDALGVLAVDSRCAEG